MDIHALRRIIEPAIIAVHEEGPPEGGPTRHSANERLSEVQSRNLHPTGWPIMDVVSIKEPA